MRTIVGLSKELLLSKILALALKQVLISLQILRLLNVNLLYLIFRVDSLLFFGHGT